MVRVLVGLSLLLLLLAGCTSVQGSLNGKLTLTVSGLPGGVQGNVVVRGNGVEKVLKASGVLELPEGEYTVEATEVTGPQGEVYAPTVRGSPVKVEYGKTAEVRVDYAVRQDTLPATLTVVIQGLPSGAEGRVTVYGPGGVSWNLTSTTTLRDVRAGTYSVFADSVVAGGRTYTPRVEPSSLTLSGGSAATVVVQYFPPDTGYLAVEITGLPSGAEGDVEVRSGGSLVATLKAPEVLEVVVGTYLVLAKDVVFQGTTYRGVVSPPSAEVRKGATALVRVSYAPVYTTGTLVVTVSGLPSGVNADVVVEGPNGFQRALTRTTTLDGLSPGVYTVTARDVPVSGGVYRATVQGSPVRVEAGAIASVEVSYALVYTTGTLTVTVSGLPSGVNGDVVVEGPNGFRRSLTKTTTLDGLLPGIYTVEARDVGASGGVYRATVRGSPVRMEAGAIASVEVSYALVYTTGTLVVAVSGLPSGVNGDVVVEGPNGFRRALTRTTTLDGLSPGIYTVEARDVPTSGGVYRATVRGSPVQVEAGATALVEASYVLVYNTGALTVTVSGLPPGVSADVVVEGPNGFQRVLTRTTTLDGLSPGTYTVTARDVATPGGVYRATVQGSPARVEAGATSGVGVNYQLDPATAPGDLLVEVNGLPSGALGNVRVQGPGGFDRSVTQTTLFSALPAGHYTVSAGNVVYSGRTYRATVSGSPVRVGGGTTATVQVSYSLYSAFLTVQISGLPGPVANVVITGANGYSRTLNRTAVLTVEPGVYAVSAYPVVVDDQTYTPRVQGSPVSLDPGESGTIQVVYQVSQ